jgi:hypothetical protein
MGTVFMAEQTQPVQHKVAVKVIKPGMDSRQVIARFEAERKALAMMDHVNIARVLDAGATEGGRKECSAPLAVAPEERASWLDQACGHDADVRRHVELRLAAGVVHTSGWRWGVRTYFHFLLLGDRS